MNREEIIKWLESLKAEMGKPEHGALWHYAEALDMAIEALQDRPTEKQVEMVFCKDCKRKDTMVCSICGVKAIR